MNLEWMAWTEPTAIFFAAIAAMIVAMTIWQVVSPSYPRRGFLPMETTRGDRFFIALITAAFLHVGWLAFSDQFLWVALVLSFGIGGLILRYG